MNEELQSDRLTGLPVEAFLERLGDGTATPGGGSAAALVGALAASLASMVARLTIGRPKYAAVEEDMKAWLGRAELLRERLTALVDDDARAYGAVTEAYALPKGTDDEKERRGAAIQAALRGAAEAPLAVAVSAVDVLELLALLAHNGNANARTDAAVAALLAHAALRGAVLNVVINLNSITDEQFGREADELVAQLMSVAQGSLAEIMSAIDPGE